MPWFLEWNDVPFFDIINATKNQHYFKVENYVRQHVDIRCRYQEHFDQIGNHDPWSLETSNIDLSKANGPQNPNSTKISWIGI